jgi:hypothetical protein
VAGAERSSAVLKHGNCPNAELALCASRRPSFSEDGSQDREMWQRMQDSLNRIVGTSSSIK